MDERQVRLVTGCLLHDIGKIVYRGGDGRNHSQGGYEYLKTDARITDREILDCVRYHHGIFLRNADVPLDSLAYVTYFADNIAAAADRREGENPESGFDISVPLASVFNILNGNRGEMHYSRQVLDPSGTINSPTVEKTPLDVGFYKKIISDITDNLKGIRLDEDYLNSLLTIMEANTSYIPSSTSRRELADISLYDHVKMTAAIGQCVEAVLKEKGIKDYRETLLKNAVESYREKWFLLYSIDISGIQKFIYSIGSEGALKGLRARSFYLEFIMEHMIDTLLDRLSLSRANLIYAGGGHCYLLLPNTKEVKDKTLQWQKENNRWFMKHFDTDLYMAAGSVECSAMELQNEPAGSYSKLFRTISEKISAQKAHRYNAEDLKNLNHKIHHGDRECRICRRMEMLDENRRCRICAALEASSGNVLYSSYFVVSEVSNGRDLPLPGGCYLKAMGKEDLKAFMSDPSYVRCYTKNEMYTGLHVTTKLLVGSYTTGKTFEELAQAADGISRIAVLRADVDNLGTAIVSGFEERYRSLSRTATFSRQLSLFFKGYINRILEEGKSSTLSRGGARNAAIVYSGGDDLFIVGAWNEVIDSFIDIRNELERFTEGTLTLSGGVGIYPGKYPVNVMAEEVAGLEKAAKELPEKNAVAVFDRSGTYPWDTFTGKVLGEKYKALDHFFSGSEERGKAFLYRLLELLRNSDEKIQFARYVYLLSRMEPKEYEGAEAIRHYQEFSRKMCEWYKDRKERSELITAIYLYVYKTREGREEG